MSKILVIAEKPSVGKNIARVLKANNNANGYLEGNKYIVTWALGHLVSLADPQVYGKEYEHWNLEALPIIFDKPKFQTLKSVQKQYNTVKKLLTRKDVTQIVIATDAGREGELVARLIIEHTKVRKPMKRLWISSITDKAIRDGFNNLKPAQDYYPLYMAALARAEADWIVGINATRALTTKYNAQLSCGRVQTPTLQMIYLQDEKVKNFKTREYFTLSILASGINFRLADKSGKIISVFNKEELDDMQKNLSKKVGEIVDIQGKKISKPAKKLYDLTTLQREANSMYGFSAKYTLDVVQSLYEYHRVLTYPRTDSQYLTEDMVNTLKERIDASNVFGFNISDINVKSINTKGFVNNSKVSDHHAIIPTEQWCNLNNLNNDEQRIYKMVVQRFLANLDKPYIYMQKKVRLNIDNNLFIAGGQEVVSKGWMKYYERIVEIEDIEEEEDQPITNIKKGDTLKVTSCIINTNYTKSPKHFTESTLLGVMENPSKYIDNTHAQKILKNTGGIGTVATRADIIEKLLNSFVIEKQGNSLKITSKGRQLLEVAPNDLKSPLLTAKWEEDLKKIENKKLNKNKFMEEIKNYTKKIIFDIKNNFYEFTHDNLTKQECPECRSKMLYASSKNGKVLTCSNIKCKHKVYIYIPKRNQCPNCMKKLEIIGDGFEKEALYCKGCGYRKNMSVLLSEQKTKGASKAEVKKLLKKQQKIQEGSNPFAKFFDKD